MVSTDGTQQSDNASALVESLQQKVERHLEQEKQRIFDEILNYPPPIPACDVQFNFLLAERVQITQELRRMREILGDCTSDLDQINSLRKFIESSQYFDSTLTARFMSDLEKVLDTCNQSTTPNQKL